MSKYLVYFNQAWVGEHAETWFAARGPLVRAVLDDMKAAGVHVFAGGLDEDPEHAFSECHQRHTDVHRRAICAEPSVPGGFTVIDVADEQAARQWAGKVAEACGWPQEVRRFSRSRMRVETAVTQKRVRVDFLSRASEESAL